MLLVTEIVGIVTMLTIMFVLIWGFILMNQMYNQLRYRNYLMEKLTQHIYMLSKKDKEKESEPLKYNNDNKDFK